VRHLRIVVAGTFVLGGAGWIALANPAGAASTTVALWHMEDTGSTMSDSSGNGHNGTLSSVTTGQTGFSGKAFGFSKNPALVTVPSSSDLNPGSSTFTVTTHANFTKLPSTKTGDDYDVIRKGLSSTSGGNWKQEITLSGRGSCTGTASSGSLTASGGKVLNDGKWHTITCVFTTSSIRLQVDGSQVASKSGKMGSISNKDSLTIGAKIIRSTSDGDQYVGLIDEVSITKS